MTVETWSAHARSWVLILIMREEIVQETTIIASLESRSFSKDFLPIKEERVLKILRLLAILLTTS